MDWPTIEDAIHAWAVAEAGISFVWAGQDSPRLAKPFGRLEISAVNNPGVDSVAYEYDADADNMATTVKGPRDFMVSIEVYSDGVTRALTARQYVEALRDSLRKPSVLAAFETANIAVIRPMPLQNIGRVISGENESRWGVDIHFAGSMSMSDTASDYVKSVEVTGDVSGNVIGPTTISDS